VIGPSPGLCLNTGQHKHRINAHTHTKHPCRKLDSNPRSRRPSERSQFIPQTARLPWPAIFHLMKLIIKISSSNWCEGRFKLITITSLSPGHKWYLWCYRWELLIHCVTVCPWVYCAGLVSSWSQSTRKYIKKIYNLDSQSLKRRFWPNSTLIRTTDGYLHITKNSTEAYF
jgi:hypothetical protein